MPFPHIYATRITPPKVAKLADKMPLPKKRTTPKYTRLFWQKIAGQRIPAPINSNTGNAARLIHRRGFLSSQRAQAERGIFERETRRLCLINKRFERKNNKVMASAAIEKKPRSSEHPKHITSTTGAILWTWQGDPFGNSQPSQAAISPTISNAQIGATAQGYTYNQRFAGQTYDKETGLYYNYFRHYDPATGRYVEADPIGLAGGWNRYAYVGGNPVKWNDPKGLWSPKGHDELIQYALEGIVQQDEIDSVKQYGRDFDKSHQATNQSHMHSMRQKNDSAEYAKNKRDVFVCDMLNSAKRAKDRNEALKAFAEAIHPIMDKYSPEHQDSNGDPKIWNPLWPFGHSPNEWLGNETTSDITPQIYQSVTGDILNAYERAFGAE